MQVFVAVGFFLSDAPLVLQHMFPPFLSWLERRFFSVPRLFSVDDSRALSFSLALVSECSVAGL